MLAWRAASVALNSLLFILLMVILQANLFLPSSHSRGRVVKWAVYMSSKLSSDRRTGSVEPTYWSRKQRRLEKEELLEALEEFANLQISKATLKSFQTDHPAFFPPVLYALKRT